MTHPGLLRAWGVLVVASLGAAVFSTALPIRAAAPAILLLALIKSRVILSDYLGLRYAPGWLRGFTAVLTLFCGLILMLYLVG